MGGVPRATVPASTLARPGGSPVLESSGQKPTSPVQGPKAPDTPQSPLVVCGLTPPNTEFRRSPSSGQDMGSEE